MFLRSFVIFGVLLGVGVGAHADELFTLADGANAVTFTLPDSVTSPQVNYNDGELAQVPGVSVAVNGTVVSNENVDFSYTAIQAASRSTTKAIQPLYWFNPVHSFSQELTPVQTPR